MGDAEPVDPRLPLENGGSQLAAAFDVVEIVRPADVAPVRLTDATVVRDYVASVASIADHYEEESCRPWPEVVADVTAAVRRQIDRRGAFVVAGDTGAFVCR